MFKDLQTVLDIHAVSNLLLQRGEHPLHISRRLVRDLLNGTEARVRFFVLIVRNPGDDIDAIRRSVRLRVSYSTWLPTRTIEPESIAYHIDNRSPEEALRVSSESAAPFVQVNELLALGTLTVSIENSKGEEILAQHGNGGEKFSIEKMSDGERSAVIMAAEVLTAKPSTVFLIDEPERHLHRAIIMPFLSALFKQREDCAFVVSTHEITLPIDSPDARVLMVRSCTWNDTAARAWDVEVLEPNTELPEELKLAILGARERILFVEGTGHYSSAGAYRPTVSRPTRLWSASPRPKLSRRWASRPNWKLMAPPCTTAKL